MSKDNDPETNRQLLQILDELIEKGPWEHGLLLQSVGNRLKALRAKYIDQLDLGQDKESIKTEALSFLKAVSGNSVPVYIALYQADGTNFKKWSQVLSAITILSISRPIYKYENEIKACMRTIEKKQNHAYVAVMVKKEEILSTTTLKDRNGFELLLVKEKAIKPENIVGFVHVTGHYSFQKGQLIKQSDVDFNE